MKYFKKNIIKNILKKIKHLKYIIIIPFLIQIFTLTIVLGYLSFTNSHKSIDNITNQLLSEIGKVAENRIKEYISKINLIIQINADAIQLKQLNPNNNYALTEYFWKQLQKLPDISYIYWGDKSGNFYGVFRLSNGNLGYSISNKSKGEKNYFYHILKDGSRGKYIQSPQVFDPRVRPWYTKAVLSKQQIWTSIYTEYTTQIRTISSAYPILAKGEIQGVIGVDVIFDQLYKFFSELKVGKNGQVIVIDRLSGEIIISSTEGEKYLKYNRIPKKEFNIKTSSDPIVKEAGKFIFKQFNNDISETTKLKPLSFKLNNQTQYMHLTSIHDNNGLDWIIAVIVPESDFMQEIYSNTYHTITLCIIALIIAVIIGISTANWIVKPILQINRVASLLARGQWNKRIFTDRSDELGELTRSFNNMASHLERLIIEIKESEKKLEENNRTLEKKVKERTQQLIAVEKLKTLGLLSAGLAHEINNPLSIALKNARNINNKFFPKLQKKFNNLKEYNFLNSQEIIDFEKELEQISKKIYKIENHTNRASIIFKRMLNQAAFNSNKNLTFNETNFCQELNSIIKSILKIVVHSKKKQYGIKNGITIKTKLDERVNIVKISPEGLNQILIVLIDNACDAVFTNRSIQSDNNISLIEESEIPEISEEEDLILSALDTDEISEEEFEFHPQIEVTTKLEKNFVIVNIFDNGGGISNKLKLFEPFNTTKKSSGGTGIGLWISKQIIEQNQGEIGYNKVFKTDTFNQKTSWTRFYIKIPVQ